MTIATTVIGSYPKPPAEGDGFTLRKTLHAVERGEASANDVLAAQDDLVRTVIAEQEEAGIALVTDGAVRWDDIVTPFASHMAGFEIGGLLRWFDNNVYYRRPVCVGPVEWRGPASVRAYEFAATVASAQVKAVIPGPISFARLSVDEHYLDHKQFVLAIARVLAQEVFELEAAGARVIQLDEPSLPDSPEDLALARRALAIITEELDAAETLVCTYFDDCKRIADGLDALPVDGIGFDLVAGPGNLEVIKGLGSEKRVQAGVVDARNTKLEQTDVLAEQMEALAALVGAERLRVAPSCGLEFLPREKARAKLEKLTEAAKKVGA